MEQTACCSAKPPAAAHRDRPTTARLPRLMQALFSDAEGEITQEQGQAVTRILLAALGCLLFYLGRGFGHGDTPFLLAAAYLLASCFHLSFVTRHRNDYLWRRYVVMLMDLGVATFLTAFFSDSGTAFYPLFLWVMIGNGIRHGQRFMQAATLLGLLGFSGAMASSGILWAHPGNYIGLMFGLVLMPRFFLVMTDRLAAANVKLQAQKEQAEFMATHDVLTGLPNRAYLHTCMQQTLARARRTGREVAVAFIDLDSFKSINDSFGHEYGDYLLAQVADAMNAVVRASDTVSRLGGDEFVVVLEDSDGGPGLSQVIERLFRCVGRYYRIGEYETYVTWSCGVVIHPRDGDDVHTLLKHADTAMYAAKSRGPNHYAFYDPSMSAQVSGQLALRDELRQALEKHQFDVYYQPIVEARTGRVTSAEALLRWHHPQRGTLSPVEFIDVAEHTGLINPIGTWVVREALAMAARWQAAVAHPVTMHVNVSTHQLKSDSFVPEMRALLRETGLPPSVLDLEVTESALLEDSGRFAALLASLKALGVGIALDDFGTGYSSLSYLKHLPVDLIKIDKSFIDGVPGDTRDCALVEAVLTLGKRFDHDIVAEGVEHPDQVEWLRQRGCRFLQGYHFSRPVNGAEFLNSANTCFDLALARRWQIGSA